ncbi:MAG: TIGR02757 family protein [Pricia sp.]
MTKAELTDFLDSKVLQYEHPKFLDSDPLQIPHLFSRKEDIEISAFLTATIAWGNRKSIINNATRLMQLMDNAPFDFVMNHQEAGVERLSTFVHRTFNGSDASYFMTALKNIYENHGGLEAVFSKNYKDAFLQSNISSFKKTFFELPHPARTQKHVSDPLRGSAAKRINMFLRWMVRPDTTGVDFGLWKSIGTERLSCPLDVHSGNVARKLKLLKRKQNDAKALAELDKSLRKLDPIDPVKYDFALFGLGVFEKF